MGTMSLFEAVTILKRHARMIVAFVAIFGISAYMMAQAMQGFTAHTLLKYRSVGSEEGLAPNGNPLNAFDIMNPQLIAFALNGMETDRDVTVEMVRNGLSVTPVVDPTISKVRDAAVEKGEDYKVYPTEYVVSYSYPASYGLEFGSRLLDRLIKAYDGWFAGAYYVRPRIANFLSSIDVESMEYMDLCDYLATNLDATISTLENLDAESNGFRSMKTGMNFKDLASRFSDIRSGDLPKFRANVLAGLLAKDSEKIIKSCEKKMGDVLLTVVSNRNDSDQCYAMLKDFRNQNTEMPVQNQEGSLDTSQVPPTFLLTQSNIVNRYVQSRVKAAQSQREYDQIALIINSYQNDKVPQATKQALIEENAGLYECMRGDIERYTDLVNQTLDEYGVSMAVKNLDYLVAVYTTKNVSVNMVVLAALAIGGAFICMACIFAEMFRRYKAAIRNGRTVNPGGEDSVAMQTASAEFHQRGPLAGMQLGSPRTGGHVL